MGVAGGFGAGKSHFLGYLAEVARGQNFVVSHTVVSKETPLSDPARVFEAAVRQARLPDRHDDALTYCLGTLRESPDRADALEQEIRDAGDRFAPIFSAILFLVRRSATLPEVLRRCERFLGGGRLNASPFKVALSGAGAGRMFDLKLPPAAMLTEQRIEFVSRLFRAAGYAMGIDYLANRHLMIRGEYRYLRSPLAVFEKGPGRTNQSPTLLLTVSAFF